MKEKGLKEWFGELSPTMQIVVAVLMIIIVWYILQYFVEFWSTFTQKAKDKGEVDALQQQGIKQSYPDNWYSVNAKKLEVAMDGMGTDEDAIFSVFNSLKNDIDFIKLDQAFGLRQNENMVGWIAGDLSTSQISTINANLATKGLSKQI